jgi:hypothetical protein
MTGNSGIFSERSLKKTAEVSSQNSIKRVRLYGGRRKGSEGNKKRGALGYLLPLP